jgi:tryptophanyl-tRNA synthetase
MEITSSFEESLHRSTKLETRIIADPTKFRVLTGDRPTGALHIGHLFGSLLNRVRLQNLGIETFVVIADYQVLTDRDSSKSIPDNVRELVLDYLSVGLDSSYIFPHSHVPALNQLILPFLTLVSVAELERNPTVKEEIKAGGLDHIKGGMFVYPVHQAADILFCKSTVIPIGKDQLPHLQITQKIAKRFNDTFSKEFFPMPEALLSDSPNILGLDALQKMSKSRGNAIFLKSTPDETAKLIRKSTTDSETMITYDPDTRPGVSNLLKILSLCERKSPVECALELGDCGSGKLKAWTIEALNEYLGPIRTKRIELSKDNTIIQSTLKKGIEKANQIANITLVEVLEKMNMNYASLR